MAKFQWEYYSSLGGYHLLCLHMVERAFLGIFIFYNFLNFFYWLYIFLYHCIYIPQSSPITSRELSSWSPVLIQIYFFKWTLILSCQGPTIMTSFSFNYFLLEYLQIDILLEYLHCLYFKTVTLGIKTLRYEMGTEREHNLIHSINS